MEVNYHKILSPELGSDFELKVYGSTGKPVMVFPCSRGRFFDYENFGMIELLKPYIENGDIVVFAVDSRDNISWLADQKNTSMGENHFRYEKAITNDVIPFLSKNYGVQERFLSTGNSWGAYHALNFILKFPKYFDCSISLSGAYSLKIAIGDYYDGSVYYNDIPMYLPDLTDQAFLKELKKSLIIICHGRGNWETTSHEAAEVAKNLFLKNIPCWYDVWDERYPHDWPAWKEQIVKFMDELKSGNNPYKKIVIGQKRVKLPLK
jgi:esterase/lipase superfamily enzyme